MPPSQKHSAQTNVTMMYTTHTLRAVRVMRGVSFSSLNGPGVSALYSCMPPIPSMGNNAMASTITPIPPSH